VVASEQPSVKEADLTGNVVVEYQIQKGDKGLFHLYGSDGLFLSRRSVEECLGALPILKRAYDEALRSLAGG
jgi:hypothetical protein